MLCPFLFHWSFCHFPFPASFFLFLSHSFASSFPLTFSVFLFFSFPLSFRSFIPFCRVVAFKVRPFPFCFSYLFHWFSWPICPVLPCLFRLHSFVWASLSILLPNSSVCSFAVFCSFLFIPPYPRAGLLVCFKVMVMTPVWEAFLLSFKIIQATHFRWV